MTDPLVSEARVQAIQARVDSGGYSEIYEPHAVADVRFLLEALDTLRQENQKLWSWYEGCVCTPEFLADHRKLVTSLRAEADTLRQERDQWKGQFSKEWQRMEIMIVENEHLEARAEAAEAECATLRAVIQEYLDWGAMTGSDRDLFEQKFRAAVVSSEPQTP